MYVAISWQGIDLDKRGLGDWGYATREIFIEDDHVSTRGFAGACHFNGPIAYETFYPLNPTDEQLAEARYESIVDEINGLINVMPINAMTAAN